MFNYNQVALIVRVCQCANIKGKGEQPIQDIYYLQSPRPYGGPPLQDRLHDSSLLLVDIGKAKGSMIQV